MTKNTYSVTVKKLPHSTIELTGIVPAAIFDATRSKAIENVGKDIELPGFRKGHVPEKVLLTKIGEGAILEEMAQIVISKAYPQMVRDEKLPVIGRPDIRVDKIAMGNPLEFVATSAVMPEVGLPDYNDISGAINKKNEEIVVTDADIEKTILEIRRMRYAQEGGKEATGPDEKQEPPKDEDLPELTDDFVRTLGKFDTLADFRAKLRENITAQKTREEKEKQRILILEGILEKSAIDLPEVIVEQELHRMEDEFTEDISRMGLDLETYLKEIKKTREELIAAWRPDAEKRAKIQLIVAEIARKENIEIKTEDLEREMNKLHLLHPDASIERMRAYVEMVMTNELVFELLESTGK